MGVKDLWNILSPLCEKKPLYELQGKTVAIDLSGWVVDSQTIVDNAVHSKMYLRNLYFRTVFFLMHGIFPVFVLEGKAPVLKHKTIARRNNVRGFQERKTSKKGGRTQFSRVLNECRELLRYMGVACVQSHGEAEAMCAYLNEDGLVDGCISQDSDCFLYGAKVVYRNFSMSTQGNCGATGGSVDVYSIEKIEKTLNIGRSKMIALALLCGCDYDEGVNGVGKEAALKFFKTVKEDNVLQRIQDWRTDRNLDRVESDLLNPNLCTSCGHPGKLQKHTKSGCTDCGTVRKCNDDFREKRALILNEVSLRKKALHDENFPNQELIDEFLIRKDSVPTKLDIKWKQPQVAQFIDFMNKHVCWEPQYAFEKIFTLTTRWQLLHLPDFTLVERLSMTNLFIPENIKKIRNIRSIASYEIIWRKEHAVMEMLNEYKEQAKENDADDDDVNANLTSIEPQDLVLRCYPELVEAYESTRNVKTKKRTANSRKKKTTIDNNKDNDIEIKETTKSKEKKVKKKTLEKNRKIDEFIQQNCAISLEESFEQMTISPKRSKWENVLSGVNELEVRDVPDAVNMNIKQMKRGPQFKRVLDTEKLNSKLSKTFDKMFDELAPDDFMSETEDNDLDVTRVIDNICSKQAFQFSMKNCQSIESTSQSTENIIERCTKSDKSEPVTYIREDYVHEEERQKSDSSDDEFGDINESYIPINQRIQIGENQNFLSTRDQIKKKFNFDFENIMDQTDNGSIHLDT
ncbi:PREDICTED: flap endonuclease GEN [Vollenhovia emeryi]|uniref:flap endonuclease GEN n=1 Tax=Vollenhovia emeryi TaxID=411798 RepID=UPI0005F41FB3|nr:PREDICTED: flap endonuclease GEN [Vollenhovia emeryi]XP_011875698.1 PREDICTED: flap endonuclease GEN [Vollenhovia emeryi]XP_011875699.1 PREDICTED: flap endonuclease GEN [Vollenhovia emeryi]XP_011875700.1 PREDICTED: flap endonuclease GEN [Vollenhovia emeryi]